jgi:hypothetical protein
MEHHRDARALAERAREDCAARAHLAQERLEEERDELRRMREQLDAVNAQKYEAEQRAALADQATQMARQHAHDAERDAAHAREESERYLRELREAEKARDSALVRAGLAEGERLAVARTNTAAG